MRTRRWILPVLLSIFIVSALGLGLTAFVEMVGVENDDIANSVRALSLTVVICSIFVISVIIPTAAVYDIVIAAKRDTETLELLSHLKSQFESGSIDEVDMLRGFRF